MQLEDLKIIQVATTATPATAKLVVADAASKTPKAITVNNLMITWLGGLPTSDPAVAGRPWLSGGVLTVSAG
jgi:hypothetical protein